jgi:carbamate kinase
MASDSKRMVIALGGNAITLPSEEGNVAQQFAHTRETMRCIADIITAGNDVVLTHGNGPQVGRILQRSEVAAEHHIYPIPMELCVADTQGGMGYMISQCLENELLSRGIDRKCATVITTVLVDESHPDFVNPTKPIGVFYREEEARRHMERDHWRMVNVPNRGWRRVVPSPDPLEIIEINLIRHLSDAGDLVVCCGGGGIPVCRHPEGGYRGVEAVIDKDRTATLLATVLDMDLLVILTSVPAVCIHYGTPQEQALGGVTTTEAQRLLDERQFPAGSMGPKVESAIGFVKASRRKDAAAIITDQQTLPAALRREAGTWIVAAE